MKTATSNLTATRTTGHIKVEDRGAVLVAHIDGGPHALFDAALTQHLKELVDRVDRDPNIHAVVFTGTHPDRFLSTLMLRGSNRAVSGSRLSIHASLELSRAWRDSLIKCRL